MLKKILVLLSLSDEKMGFLIEKTIAIASTKQLDMFEQYLDLRNHTLPLLLVKTIRKFPHENSSFYANKIYQNHNADAIKKLTQLAHHTFKLSSFLSQHFPHYVLNALEQFDVLQIENKKTEALELLKTAIEVAQKIEDFHALIVLYEIANQQFYGFSKTLPKNYLTESVKTQDVLISILAVQDNLVRNAENSVTNTNIKKELLFLKAYFSSKTKSVQLIAKQSYLQLLSHFNHPDFYKKETLTLIKYVLNEIESHPYLSIVRHKDKMMSLDYMYLKHTRLIIDEKEINSACSKIINKWKTHYVAENTIDTGLFLALSVQGSYLITSYYFSKIPAKLNHNIKETIDLCESLLHKIDWDKEGFLKHLNFCNVYALFLILANQEKKAIKLIESILHQYQQKSFKKLYDGLFVILVMAYLQGNLFDEVAATFSRYKKLVKDDVTIIENDLIIRALYYIAQQKIQGKKQYQQKLDAVLTELRKDATLNANLLLVERTIKGLIA
ncbi:MAG: hypothetical protein KF732_05040 [Flavobacteriales bacterium]|nr:hypothetical protein [Flavobacteriales bacterium]